MNNVIIDIAQSDLKNEDLIYIESDVDHSTAADYCYNRYSLINREKLICIDIENTCNVVMDYKQAKYLRDQLDLVLKSKLERMEKLYGNH